MQISRKIQPRNKPIFSNVHSGVTIRKKYSSMAKRAANMLISTAKILYILLTRSSRNRHRGLTKDAYVENVFTTSRNALTMCEVIKRIIAVPYL